LNNSSGKKTFLLPLLFSHFPNEEESAENDPLKPTKEGNGDGKQQKPKEGETN
jgi:hypothetical protein